MAFELRAGGQVLARYETEEAAMAAASEMIRRDPDAAPDVIDTETGQPAAPGASAAWRDDLARKTGY